MEVRQLGTALGAEIRGVDLSRPLDAAAVDFIRAAFLDHIVLTIRDQSVPPEAQSRRAYRRASHRRRAATHRPAGGAHPSANGP